MTSIAYALARAGLIRVLTAYAGITTADGAADGTTLIDTNLIGRNDFITEKSIIVMSGDAKDEDKGAASFDNGTGTITLQGTGFSAQIKAGTIYRVLNISTVEIDVANINTKIGTNTDAPGTTTVFARLRQIVDSYLADATIGLAAIKALLDPEIADLLADVGDASASTLGSLYAILGNPTQSFLTMIGYEGATSLADKLTAARAALLDEITAARMAELDAANIPADIDTLLARLTAARAGYLDNINNPDLANLIRQVAETTGTFAFDETSALEQDMVTVTISARAGVGTIWLDMVNVTRDTTIKPYHKVDGTNFREIKGKSVSWVTTDPDGVLIEGFTAYRDIKVSLTCDGLGAGSVNVPYAIV